MNEAKAIQMALTSIPSTSIHIDSTSGPVTIDPKKSGKFLWSVTKEELTKKPEIRQTDDFAYHLKAITDNIHNRKCIFCEKTKIKFDSQKKPQFKTIEACKHTICYSCIESDSGIEKVREHIAQPHPTILYETDALIIDTPQKEIDAFINLYVNCPVIGCKKKCKIAKMPTHLREKHSQRIKQTKAVKVPASPSPTKKETRSPLLTARRLGHRRTASLSDVPSQATPKPESTTLSMERQKKPFATVRRSPSLSRRAPADEQLYRALQRPSSLPVFHTLVPLKYEEKLKEEIAQESRDFREQAVKMSGSLSSFTVSSDSLAGTASQIQTTPEARSDIPLSTQRKDVIQELKQHKSMQRTQFDPDKYHEAIEELSHRHKRHYEDEVFFSAAEKLKREKPEICNLTGYDSIVVFKHEVLQVVKKLYPEKETLPVA